MCAKHYENPTMLSKVTAKNVRDVYETHCRKVSVRLSVKRVDCDKTEEGSVQIFVPYERSFSLVF